MRNSYYIKWGSARNQYELCYAPAGVNPGDGWEQITRKEAEHYASEEAARRKEDSSFAYYADDYVYPYDLSEDEAYVFMCRHLGWHSVGRIVVPGRRLNIKEV